MTGQRQREPSGADMGRGGAIEEVSAGGVVFRRAVAGTPAGTPEARLDATPDAAPDATLFLLIKDSYGNWGFPKGHLNDGEPPDQAALREVAEETGLTRLALRGPVERIDWHFRFRGRLIHKVCHFFVMETGDADAQPLRAEGITACCWATYDEAMRLIAYDNARTVLARARAIIIEVETTAPPSGAPLTRPAEP